MLGVTIVASGLGARTSARNVGFGTDEWARCRCAARLRHMGHRPCKFFHGEVECLYHRGAMKTGEPGWVTIYCVWSMACSVQHWTAIPLGAQQHIRVFLELASSLSFLFSFWVLELCATCLSSSTRGNSTLAGFVCGNLNRLAGAHGHLESLFGMGSPDHHNATALRYFSSNSGRPLSACLFVCSLPSATQVVEPHPGSVCLPCKGAARPAGCRRCAHSAPIICVSCQPAVCVPA